MSKKKKRLFLMHAGCPGYLRQATRGEYVCVECGESVDIGVINTSRPDKWRAHKPPVISDD